MLKFPHKLRFLELKKKKKPHWELGFAKERHARSRAVSWWVQAHLRPLTACVCSPTHRHALGAAPSPAAPLTTSVPSLTEIPHVRAPVSVSGSNSA